LSCSQAVKFSWKKPGFLAAQRQLKISSYAA